MPDNTTKPNADKTVWLSARNNESCNGKSGVIFDNCISNACRNTDQPWQWNDFSSGFIHF